MILILENTCFDDAQVYVEGLSTHAVQTAWAMLALIYAGHVQFDQHILFSDRNTQLDVKTSYFF